MYFIFSSTNANQFIQTIEFKISRSILQLRQHRRPFNIIQVVIDDIVALVKSIDEDLDRSSALFKRILIAIALVIDGNDLEDEEEIENHMKRCWSSTIN